MNREEAARVVDLALHHALLEFQTQKVEDLAAKAAEVVAVRPTVDTQKTVVVPTSFLALYLELLETWAWTCARTVDETVAAKLESLMRVFRTGTYFAVNVLCPENIISS